MKASSASFSLLRFFLKGVIVLLLIAVVLSTAVFFVLPSLISSDLGREKAAAFLAKELERPVSIETLSFSWSKGVAVTGLIIKNQDHSPLLSLNHFKVTVSWLALLARRISVQTLSIDGVEMTLVRDTSGKTTISDLWEAPGKEPSPKKKPKPLPRDIPALFLDAHLKNGTFIFIDQRLATTTRIRNLNADVSVRSLLEPIELLLSGEIIVNEKSPDPLSITGLVHLAPEGSIDPRKSQGKLEMQAGFGSFSALFDLAKFGAAGEAAGASLSCFIDLDKLGQLSAGIFGFPPDFSMRGQVASKLEARGNLESQIAIRGNSRLTEVALTGGPFKDAPLRQPEIDFVQDVTLSFAKKVIEISRFDFKGGFLDLSASGSVSDFQNDPTYALKIKGNGSLREITKVLEKLLPLPADVRISGTMGFAFSVTGPSSRLHVKGRTATEDFTIIAPRFEGRPFQEESLEITPDCLLNIPDKSLKITSLRFRSGLLSGDLEGTLGSDQSVAMNVRLSAALENLKKELFKLLPPAFPSQGNLSSQVTLQGNLNKSLSLKGDHSIEGALITPPPGAEGHQPSAPIAIPEFSLSHDLLYTAAQENLTISKLEANSSFLNFEGSGTLSQISKNQVAKCQGHLALDLTEIDPLLKTFLSEKLAARGKGALAFAGAGNLKSLDGKPLLSSWDGNGSLSLEAIDYEGFGTVKNLRSTKLSLEKGLLRFALECLLNDGPARFQGLLDFRSQKPAMTINLEANEGRVSQDLGLLGYVVPILITSPSGSFSGTGDFSMQASWQGTDWDSEISKTITGKGLLNLKDGILQNEEVLSIILKLSGKPGTLEFEEILTDFRLGEGKIFNDNIQVNTKDLQLGLRGWTALAYEPSEQGNPMDYAVTGDFLNEFIGKDGEKLLALLGGGEPTLPIGIGGTVQKPKVLVEMPKAADLLRGLFCPRQ